MDTPIRPARRIIPTSDDAWRTRHSFSRVPANPRVGTICHEAESNGDGTYLFHFSQWDSLSLRPGHRSGRCRQCHIVSGDFVSKLDAAGAVFPDSAICCPDSGRRRRSLGARPSRKCLCCGKHHSKTAASESERWCIGVRYISCFGSEALWQPPLHSSFQSFSQQRA